MDENKTGVPATPTTDEELEKLIADRVEKAVAEREAELEKKFNQDMATARIRAKDDKENAIKKALEEANLSAEELAKKQVEEQIREKDKELETLRQYKKVGELSKKLKEASIPEMFINDSRLLNAKEEEIDSVIKTIKEDYSKLLPSGATVSTNVNVGATQTNDPKAQKFKEFSKLM